ncbi:MAG: hypothetical protein ACREX6_12150 [Casimicrobiaceae bacterium]
MQVTDSNLTFDLIEGAVELSAADAAPLHRKPGPFGNLARA